MAVTPFVTHLVDNDNIHLTLAWRNANRVELHKPSNILHKCCIICSKTIPIKHARVTVGENVLYEEESAQSTFKIDKIYRHADYEKGHSNENDITLLKLEAPIKFTRQVSPVCLPKKDVPEGKMCVVTGWGRTEGESTAYTQHTCLEHVQPMAEELCSRIRN